MSSDKSALVALTEDQIGLLVFLCQEMLKTPDQRTWNNLNPDGKKELAGAIGQLKIALYALSQEEAGR